MTPVRFQDLHWSLASTDGPLGLPSNADLGIRTTPVSNAHPTGRLDELKIEEDRLWLHATHAHLDSASEGVVPVGTHVQDPSEVVGGKEGATSFVYDSHPVAFTGTLVLGRELNLEHYVHLGHQAPNRFEYRAILDFEEGHLIKVTMEEGSTPDAPPQPSRIGLPMILGAVGIAAVIGTLLWWAL